MLDYDRIWAPDKNSPLKGLKKKSTAGGLTWAPPIEPDTLLLLKCYLTAVGDLIASPLEVHKPSLYAFPLSFSVCMKGKRVYGQEDDIKQLGSPVIH